MLRHVALSPTPSLEPEDDVVVIDVVDRLPPFELLQRVYERLLSSRRRRRRLHPPEMRSRRRRRRRVDADEPEAGPLQASAGEFFRFGDVRQRQIPAVTAV